MAKQLFKSESDLTGIEARLEALITVLVPFIRSSVENKNEFKSTEDKTIVLLVKDAHISQARAAKIMGVDINRVNKACKK